eukprot:TRINITY_DN12806_c0_g3_i4.p1 TRINITY_DN12806_c0_g3~~TRINITY_DN12806_c0_g3_i4.p1  ORF type:complete len:133 (+),score=4.57 TRINITY_DN12806_c0_g3_i4:70-468(+)
MCIRDRSTWDQLLWVRTEVIGTVVFYMLSMHFTSSSPRRIEKKPLAVDLYCVPFVVGRSKASLWVISHSLGIPINADNLDVKNICYRLVKSGIPRANSLPIPESSFRRYIHTRSRMKAFYVIVDVEAKPAVN